MVTMLTPQEVNQLKKIRFSIELQVLEDVCAEASGEEIRSLRDFISDDFVEGSNANELNTRFHIELAKRSKNRFLVEILQDIIGSLSRVEQHIPQEILHTWQEPHQAIIDALAARDLQRAERALRRDLEM